MSTDAGDQLIQEAQVKLHDAQQKAIDLKKFINQIREFQGREPMFADIEEKPVSHGNAAVRADQFYGQPLATVVRKVLEMRRDRGAATVEEIHAKMKEGGFDFDTPTEENQLRVLRISLSKNPAFHRLPSGRYGLTDWYPNRPGTKVRKPSNNLTEDLLGLEAESQGEAKVEASDVSVDDI